MPFYHTPEATEYLKAFLGEHYESDDTPAFKALWRSYNSCQFVEDDGRFFATTECSGISSYLQVKYCFTEIERDMLFASPSEQVGRTNDENPCYGSCMHREI